MKAKPTSVTLKADQKWLSALDDWRVKKRPVLSRSEAIRELVERGLSKSGKG